MNNDIKPKGNDFEVVQPSAAGNYEKIKELIASGDRLPDTEILAHPQSSYNLKDFTLKASLARTELKAMYDELMGLRERSAYNPATHILIAKDEVPKGLGEALKAVNSFIEERERLRGMGDCVYSIHSGCENEQNLNASHLKILCTALIAAKMGDE